MSTQISTLDISNFQRLSKAVIQPSGNVIMVCGKNANGKTSVLDALESLLCGHNGRNIKRPIHDGAGKATIETKLTDGTVLVRKYTPSGTTLTAKGPDGSKLGQKDLDRMISALGVDASTFATSGEKEQLKTLLSVVDLPFVPAELDAQRKAVFDERTAVNRRVKELVAQASVFLAFPADHPTEEVSVSDLLTQHHTAVQQNNAVNQANEAMEAWQQAVEQMRAKLAEAEESLAKAIDHASGAPALIDTDAIQQRIDTAEQSNAAARQYQAAQKVKAELATTEATADELTDKLARIDMDKAEGLANAEMPVEGLSFDEEGVLYQGVPFSRASGSEQIIVSAAMIIATDPELRTMVIRNGNVLDAASMETLEHMLEDNNFQAFIEFVSDGEDHEFRLVDGELAA